MATEKELPFEEAMKRLEGIVLQLEQGDLSLDKSLEAFEQGATYVSMCQGKLTEAEMRIEKMMKTRKEK